MESLRKHCVAWIWSIIPFAEIKAILIQYKADDHTYTTERFRELQRKKVDNPMKKRL